MNILIILLLVLLPTRALATLIFENNYNNGTFGTNGVNVDQCTPSAGCVSPFFQSVPNPGAITAVNTPTPREGAFAVRHIARPAFINTPAHSANPSKWNPCILIGADLTNSTGCDRSESEFAIPFSSLTRWYGFSIYIDASTQYSQNLSAPVFHDLNGQVVFQVHQLDPPCGSGFGPAFVMYFSKNTGQWTVQNDTDNTLPCPNSGSRVRHVIQLGAWAPDVGHWVDWAIQANWSTTSSGNLRIYKNGVLVAQQLNTPNSFNNIGRNDIKWGVYQSWWTVQDPPPSEQSVVYHDAIKVGDQNSSLGEVSPNALPSPPTNVQVIVE